MSHRGFLGRKWDAHFLLKEQSVPVGIWCPDLPPPKAISGPMHNSSLLMISVSVCNPHWLAKKKLKGASHHGPKRVVMGMLLADAARPLRYRAVQRSSSREQKHSRCSRAPRKLAPQGKSNNATPARKGILTYYQFPNWDGGGAMGDESRWDSFTSSRNTLTEKMLFQSS